MYSLALRTDFEERRLGRAWGELQLAVFLLPLGLGQRAREALLQAVQALESAGIGVLHRTGGGFFAGQVGGDNEVDLLLDVVEGKHLVKEHQAGVRYAQFVGSQRGQALDLAYDIVGKEADRAGSERRQAGQARGGVAAEGLLQLGEDVALEGAAARQFAVGSLLIHRDRWPARDDPLVRLDADEGIAADVLATLDGFEQKGFRLLGCYAQEGRDGCFQVRGDRLR